MAKNLQKNADFYRKNVGIVDPEKFAQTVHIEYFEPCEQLRPLVAHYFVAHNKTSKSYAATTVLSQPAMHLVFTANDSFISGVTTQKSSMVIEPLETYAGVRFKPGGFYPFYKRPMAAFTEKQTPAATVFPEADSTFVQQLLAKPDNEIANQLEALLLRHGGENDQKTAIIANVFAAIQKQPQTTVKEVASACNMSERTLQDLFTTRVGIGLKWIIARTRFLEAMERAHADETPNWAFVAADAGYSSQSHFVNDFKKIMGMSPRAYIKLLAD